MKRIKQPLPAMFAEECLFQATIATMALFAKLTYKVQLQFWFNSKQLLIPIRLIDTKAGLNIASKMFFTKNVLQSLEISQYQYRIAQLKTPIQPLGPIHIIGCISASQIKVWFGVIENLAENMLQHPPFTDHFSLGLFPGKRSVVPWHSRPVPILTREFLKIERQFLHLGSLNSAGIPYKAIVQISKQAFLPVLNQNAGKRNPTRCRSIFTWTSASQSTIFPPPSRTRVIDTPNGSLFGTIVSNFGATIQLLLKRMLVAYVVAAPVEIADLPHKQTGRTLQEN